MLLRLLRSEFCHIAVCEQNLDWRVAGAGDFSGAEVGAQIGDSSANDLNHEVVGAVLRIAFPGLWCHAQLGVARGDGSPGCARRGHLFYVAFHNAVSLAWPVPAVRVARCCGDLLVRRHVEPQTVQCHLFLIG